MSRVIEQKIEEFGDVRDAMSGCGWYDLVLKLDDGKEVVIHNHQLGTLPKDYFVGKLIEIR